MLLTLIQMDNLRQIECHQRICNCFFIFNLTCCKFVALKENTLTHSFQNHYSKQTKHSSEFSLSSDQDVTLRERIRGSGPLCKAKSLNFPVCWISPPVPLPFPDHRPHIGNKNISNSFQTNFTKKFSWGTYFKQHTIMTDLKKLTGNKSLNTRLSSRIISLNLHGKLWG